MTPMCHRVLLVDDEPALLGAVRRLVERVHPDALVVYASDAETAVWQVETTPIGFVVTDLRMQGDNEAGWQVVRAAQAAGVPVAVLTSRVGGEQVPGPGTTPVPWIDKRSMHDPLAALLDKAFSS